MEAQAWTAIGLLAATLLGALFYLGNRIDGLGSEMRGRIDGLGSEMRGQFQAQGSRIDAVSARMDGLADRIYELAVKLDDHLRRHAS